LLAAAGVPERAAPALASVPLKVVMP
jgi:hypothetical protein